MSPKSLKETLTLQVVCHTHLKIVPAKPSLIIFILHFQNLPPSHQNLNTHHCSLGANHLLLINQIGLRNLKLGL
jgi:hypothetical protein